MKKKQKDCNRKKDKGFTLIEMLIVMVIIGLLAALVAPRMFGKVGKSKQKAAKAQITLFETALVNSVLFYHPYHSVLSKAREGV